VATRRRIVAAADNGENWQALAAANGVKSQTAYRWVRKGDAQQKPRGGTKPAALKIGTEHKQAMIDRLNDEPQMTLREIAVRLQLVFGLYVSGSTIARHLDGRMISLKQVHCQPEAMNNLRNKRLRKQYVEKLMQAMGADKFVVYVDESHVNLFLRRSQGRSQQGTRAVVKLPSSKGANVHMIGALSQTGLVSFKRKRGNFRGVHFDEWLQKVVQKLVSRCIPQEKIVLVVDNAPCHSRAEAALQPFPGASILRLGLYSPMLNPIEAAWNTIKAELKSKEAASLAQLLAGAPAGMTQTEWRLQYVEGLIDGARKLV